MSTNNNDTPSSMYHIDQLCEDNWIPWKRRVGAIFCDCGMQEMVDGLTAKPIAADPSAPTATEMKAIKACVELDGKAQTQIELTLRDGQMIHIAGAKTAAEMWKQLKQMKERSGKL